MAEVAVPLIASAVGGGLSAQGSKKAAKGAKPQIPEEFRGPLAAALGLLTAGIQNRGGIGGTLGNPWQPFAGGSPFAAPLNSLQNTALGGLEAMLGPNISAANTGLADALTTIRAISAAGLDPATVKFVSDQLAPFFEGQREAGVAGVREASAARGGFFGSGSATAEGDFLRKLASEQSAQVLPLALQSQALRLGAAQSIPGLITGTQESLIGQLLNALQGGEIARGAANQALPVQGINFLAALMGGTPFVQQAVPTNFLQSFGSNVSSLGSSPGFTSLFQGKNPKASTAGTPLPATSPGGVVN